MSAIAPPPVGSEPSVLTDNRKAVAALRGAHLPERAPEAQLRRVRSSSLLALLALGVATVVAATIGAIVSGRRRDGVWYRLQRLAR